MMQATLLVFLCLFVVHAAHILLRRLADEEHATRLEPRTADTPPLAAPPKVSVVVPARNEEAHLEGCLSALRALRYDPLEIVVVDDRSTDRTGVIAEQAARRDPRVRVVRGAETPPGWTGKNFAIHQGARLASGAYLLIVDADTALAPEVLERAVGLAESEGVDLLTLHPGVVCTSFWEKALMPWLGVLSTFRMDRVNDPEHKEAMAYGYFLLFRRTAFDAVGGYEAIRDRVGEDWIMARRIKASGLRLKMLLAPGLVTKRFGPSLQEIWQGFTKNFILIMEGRKAVAVLALPLMLYYLLFTVAPWVAVLVAPLLLLTQGWDPFPVLLLLLALLQIALIGGTRLLLRFFLGLDVSAPWLQPVGGAVIAAMGLTAIYRTLAGKGIAWRGRRYKSF